MIFFTKCFSLPQETWLPMKRWNWGTDDYFKVWGFALGLFVFCKKVRGNGLPAPLVLALVLWNTFTHNNEYFSNEWPSKRYSFESQSYAFIIPPWMLWAMLYLIYIINLKHDLYIKQLTTSSLLHFIYLNFHSPFHAFN